MANSDEPHSGEQPASAKASAKRRPAYSCLPCKARKVRCDRIRPCKACCLRGKPEGCIFEVHDEARNALSQLEEIQHLRSEVSKLRAKLDEGEGSDAGPSVAAVHDPPRYSTMTTAQRKFLAQQREVIVNAHRQIASLNQSHVPFSFVKGLFVERLVDRFAPNVAGARQWLRFVASESTDETSTLTMALDALSIASCGATDHDRALQMQAHDIYTRVLRQLQKELNSPDSSRSAHVLYATMVVSLFELLIRNNPLSWLIHLNGMSRLIQHRGPDKFVSGLEHETLRFFRMFGLTLCVFTRRPTFLSQPVWKSIPWSRGYPSKDMLDLLLDHVLDIPDLLFQADMLRQDAASGRSPREALAAASKDLGARLTRLYLGLEQWRRDWAMTYPGVQELLDSQSSGDSSSTGDASADENSERVPLIDYPHAIAVCMYYAGKLLLTRALVAFDKLTPQKTQELVALICEGAEFSLQVIEDYFGALRLLFPLRVAYFSAAEQGPYRPRIQRCLDVLATQYQVLFARVLLSSLPGFAGQVQLSTMSTPSPPGEDSPPDQTASSQTSPPETATK